MTDSNQHSRQSRWVVSQVGRREDYAAARAFHRSGNLARLYTDCWASTGRSVLARCPRGVRDLRNRYHPDVPRRSVVSFTPRFTAGHLCRVLRGWPRSAAALREHHLGVSRSYDRMVARHLRRHGPGEGAGAFLGFTSGALRSLRAASEMGLGTVLDQVDAAQVDWRIVAEEVNRWPGWEPHEPWAWGPQAYWDTVAEEWAAADVILVNSEFSRDALIRQGVAPAKLIVVPLAFEAGASAASPGGPRTAERADQSAGAGGTLRVLWLGSVTLRKGIQYLVGAARELLSADVEFLVAGPVGVTPHALATFPPNVRVLGKVSGPPKAELYRSADVFVLPTLSDGFAITQIEAMAFGLPVVATPNCGRVVTHGRDGLIVPARDPAALADALLSLARDRPLLAEMSEQALLKSRQFSLDNYARTMQSELRRVGFRGAAVDSDESVEGVEVAETAGRIGSSADEAARPLRAAG